MTWRIYVDESYYSDAELIAWEWEMPYHHLLILDDDRKNVQRTKELLEKTFSKQALKAAVKKLELIRNKPYKGE